MLADIGKSWAQSGKNLLAETTSMPTSRTSVGKMKRISSRARFYGATEEEATLRVRLARKEEERKGRERRKKRKNRWKAEAVDRDDEFDRTAEGAEALYNSQHTPLKRILGLENMDEIHTGFQQGGGYTDPIMDALPLKLAYKESALLVKHKGIPLSTRICLTGHHLCIARGGDPRTMTDRIPLMEMVKVEMLQDGEWVIVVPAECLSVCLSVSLSDRLSV